MATRPLQSVHVPPVALALNQVAPAPGTAAEPQPPEWVQLLPAGEIRGVDGRAWLNDRPEQIVEAFRVLNRPIPIDYEHATHVAAPAGQAAPAAGWIEEVKVHEGSLWGRVVWTPRGAEMVKAREYRFLSPVFLHEKEPSRRVVRLLSAGLTNTPNLTMTALNQAEVAYTDSLMNKELLDLLGLPETATEADVIAAVKKLKGEMAVAANSALTPPLEKFVPRADYDAVMNRVKLADEALAKHRSAALDAEIDTAITGALAAKKIVPATQEYYRAMCRQEGGLAKFQEFVKAAPLIAGASGLEKKDPAAGKSTATDQQLAICKTMGMNPEIYQKAIA